jgi:hypothetical protein
MDPRPQFELQISLPHDVRLAETVRSLAVYAAHVTGCADAQAEAFGRSVEEVVRAYLEDATSGHDVPVVLRRGEGPLEVRIDTRTLTLDV